jgi:hypothetical protein
MKRTSMKNKQLKLKRRLELVRTTVRELTPAQLGQVNGGEATGGCQEGTNDVTGLMCLTICVPYTCDDR